MQPKYGKAALSLKRMVQNGIMSEREKVDFLGKGDVLVAKQKRIGGTPKRLVIIT